MKKLAINILIIGLLVISFACEKEEHAVNTETKDSPGFKLAPGPITELDDNVSVSVSDVGSGITEFTIIHHSTGNEVGSVSISDGEGTAVIPKGDIGLAKAGDAANLLFEGNNSLNSTRKTSVAMTHPVTTFELSEGTVYNNDAPHKLYFAVAPVQETVEDVTVEKKVGVNSDYTTDSTFTTLEDSLMFMGSPYENSDTVYYRITASDGDETTTPKELSFVVQKWSFANSGSAILDTTTNHAFDLVANEHVMAGGDTSDIEWIHDPVNNEIGIESNQNAMFDKVNASETLWMNNDINVIKASYTDTDAQQTHNDVKPGDYFIYKTTRTMDGETKEHYGMIKIVQTYFTESGDGDYLEFEYLN